MKAKRFNAGKVEVGGLSRKEAAKKRKAAFFRFQLENDIKDVLHMEQSKCERSAWKVRSYLANKERQ